MEKALFSKRQQFSSDMESLQREIQTQAELKASLKVLRSRPTEKYQRNSSIMSFEITFGTCLLNSAFSHADTTGRAGVEERWLAHGSV